VLAVSEHLEQLDPVEIVIVHFDETDRLHEYRSFHGVPDDVRIVADPERTLYRTLGIGRGRWWRVWGPRTFRAYLRLMREGRRYRRHRGDSLQLGGDVVVGADGRVAWTFLPAEPDARPTHQQIEAAVDTARA